MSLQPRRRWRRWRCYCCSNSNRRRGREQTPRRLRGKLLARRRPCQTVFFVKETDKVAGSERAEKRERERASEIFFRTSASRTKATCRVARHAPPRTVTDPATVTSASRASLAVMVAWTGEFPACFFSSFEREGGRLSFLFFPCLAHSRPCLSSSAPQSQPPSSETGA